MNTQQLLSTTAAIDPLFMYIFGACLLLLLGITLVMLFFVFRYHRSRAPQPTSQVEGNLWLEIIWIVLPSLLVLAMFWYGWKEYLVLRSVPQGALPVTATARMWSWEFTYANGKSSPKLYVPIGKPVRVELVSKDVIHGFFLPAFRVKRDVVPGMANYVWFVATQSGSYDLFCSQYCGTQHSAMVTTVEAVSEEQFAVWLNQTKTGNAGAGVDGRKLATEKGCLGCHSLDGSSAVGPTFKGLFASQVKVMKEGKPLVVTADEAYLRESIRLPGATIVDGFPPIMPGNPDLPEEEVLALVEFIKGLK
ncbi:MAG: cytochrome c oxidase subunit II [Desulfuromonadales bacterium]